MTADLGLRGFDRAFLETYQGYPGVFGDPEGRRARLQDFIEISELRQSALFSPETSRVRVVVGRKGSGKTLYMAKLQSLERGALDDIHPSTS